MEKSILTKIVIGKGYGILFALFLLASCEILLHGDFFLNRYRSVFAAGRAMDKVRYIENNIPELIVAGNSRVDNGIDPKTLQYYLHPLFTGEIFNLGIPGANARVLFGIFSRFGKKGLLGSDGIQKVVIGIDENFLQKEDNLGYSVFFADTISLLRNGEFKDYFSTLFRIWGYAENLKQLREPAKLIRFVEASFKPVEPIGGGAYEHFGYRANSSDKFQNKEQVSVQMAGSENPPMDIVVGYFWQLVDLLEKHDIEVMVFLPPLLNRELFSHDHPHAELYIKIVNQLRDRGIPLVDLASGVERSIDEFANPGHLNDKGAQRFTKILAEKLQRLWLRNHRLEKV